MQALTAKRLPVWLFIVMIPVLLGLGALCVLWYWNTHKDSIIKNKINEAIKEKSEGLYTIRYNRTKMDELKGDLSFYDLHLSFDSAIYLAAEKKGVAPPMLFTVDIPEISVSGVETSRAMSKNEIVGQKLFIRKPSIDLFYTYQGKDADITMPTNDLYKEILSGLNLVQVDTIFLSDATIRTINSKTGQVLAQGNNISITLADVKIDSTAFEDQTRMMFSKDVNIDVGNIRWTSDDKLYNFSIGKINLNSVNNTLQVGRFDMKPALGEDAFINRLPFQGERFDLSLANINLTNVNTKRLLQEDLQADAMTIPFLSLKVYCDLAKPRNNKSKVGHYPHQVLDNVPFLFSVKKIMISNSYVEYKEKNNITRQTGTVRFHHLNGVFSNVTNNKKAAGQEMSAVINAKLLDQAAFTTRWKFYLFHPQGRFDLSGSVNAMNAALFNPLIEASGPGTIREGKLDGLDFSLQGDDGKMRGNVKLLYSDLKIDLLNNKKSGDKKTMGSFLANMIIKNSNPNKNEKIREMNVSMTRDVNRSLFWLCWKTIFKGIKETVGIKENTERVKKRNGELRGTNKR